MTKYNYAIVKDTEALPFFTPNRIYSVKKSPSEKRKFEVYIMLDVYLKYSLEEEQLILFEGMQDACLYRERMLKARALI